jgi:ribonuclease VapC
MNKYVLDASALLASLHSEIGCEIVDMFLPESAISTVNLSEVIQKAKQRGIVTDTIVERLQIVGVEIVDFTIEQAEIAATLWKITKPFGLSLGDRSYLALAQSLNAIAITADKTWANIPNIQVQVIR